MGASGSRRRRRRREEGHGAGRGTGGGVGRTGELRTQKQGIKEDASNRLQVVCILTNITPESLLSPQVDDGGV